MHPVRTLARLAGVTRVVFALAATAAAAGAQSATISGRVTAEGSGAPLGDSRVVVVGTNLIASTNAEGRYTLRNVPAGPTQVRVLRVGYIEQKQPITVAAGQAVTLDFTLKQTVIQLQDVVTTATGQQRRVELGNAVASVGDVNKRVEETPTLNTYDLLTAKAPGVVVLAGSMTGTAGAIRIRGLNSLSLSNAPIWVVDGVRFTSGSVTVQSNQSATSFLNGLNPEEIEDIEIVKGPSAATLYGTDAANGVIVVTTKKGRAGPARWTWYGEGGLVKDQNHYPDTYAIWGHSATNASTLQRCTLLTIAAGSCVRDSVSSFNVLDTPGLSPLATGNRGQVGLNVSGGTDVVRYFVSGELEGETGPIKLPDVDVARYNDAGVPIREEWMNPEHLGRQSVRANLNAAVSPKFDLNVTSGFVKTNQRVAQTDNNFFSIFYQSMMSPGFRQPGLGVTQRGTRGEELNGNNGYTYADIFQRYVREDVQRYVASANASWRPYSWLMNQGTVGMDLADRWDYTLCRFQECPDQGTQRQGTVSSQTSNNRNFSAKLSSTATWQARTWLNLQTTAGADYTNIENDNTNSSGTQLPPGAQTVGSAASRLGGSTLPTANKTLGVYLQEQLSFRERLYLTLAARSDQNSAFGVNYGNAVYPKASVSWLLSDEAFFPRYDWLNSLRLRSAYGASGVQPGALDALVTYGASTVNVLSTDTPGLVQTRLGNPDLKPETSAEFETGFETRLWDRVNVDFTFYRKQTRDALIDQPIAPSAAAPVTTQLRNLGSIRNSGLELLVNTTLVNRRQLGWDLTISGSRNTNRIVSLGQDTMIGTGTVRQKVGFPINGLFYRPYTYADANGNGIVEAAEVTVPPDYQYLGYSAPRSILSFTNNVDLLDRKLRLAGMIDYKGGFYIQNGTNSFQCGNNPACPARSNPATSLEDQAAYVATTKNPSTSRGYAEKADFWRLRELSATYELPRRLATPVRARDISLSLGARNVKVWTNYKGADPEEGYLNASAGGDQQSTFASSAPRAYYTLRLNLHY
jgi:TonB-linked SusC/RagA family outer membrane protein